MKRVFVGIFCAVVVLSSVGCVSFEKSIRLMEPELDPPFPAKVLKGVWTPRNDSTPSYEVLLLPDGSWAMVKTNETHNHSWVFLVDPPIEKDRVYLEDGTFFFRDQLVPEKNPVYEIKLGVISYHLEGEGESAKVVADEYDWENQYGGEFPYLVGNPLEERVRDKNPERIYLSADEVPLSWISEGDWAHFFKREDVVLLNP